jgi:hypothetical protein
VERPKRSEILDKTLGIPKFIGRRLTIRAWSELPASPDAPRPPVRVPVQVMPEQPEEYPRPVFEED